MTPGERDLGDRRGLRVRFSATAEVLPATSNKSIAARVTELSFRGCFLEISAILKEQQRIHVKISHSNEHFEASAHVLYLRPSGAGLLFTEIQPQFRNVLQSWILVRLDDQAKSTHP